jgi:hypothetical protein
METTKMDRTKVGRTKEDIKIRLEQKWLSRYSGITSLFSLFHRPCVGGLFLIPSKEKSKTQEHRRTQ